MIKEKTVFVFGAGLSSDYGFPTGKSLRDDIVQYINWNIGNLDLPTQIKRLVNMGFNENTIIRTRDKVYTVDSKVNYLNKPLLVLVEGFKK